MRTPKGPDGWNPGRPACLTRRSIWPRSISRRAPQWRTWRGPRGTRRSRSRPRPGRARIGAAIEKEYLLPGGGFYAFSRNADGSVDSSPTIFPAVASWDGSYKLQHAQPMLDRWAAPEFSTDWGTRDLSPTVSFFDPISYHQGTVWPLYTGWVAVSEYRNGRSLSGYAHLMQNADLTWAQDPGAVTELLSGQFFAPLGRSTSHQLWSSAMVISPVLRGLFGLEWDAAGKKLTVTPSLPAEWDRAKLRHVPLAGGAIDLEMTRAGAMLLVRATGSSAQSVVLDSRTPGAKWAGGVLRIPLPAVEAGLSHALPEARSDDPADESAGPAVCGQFAVAEVVGAGQQSPDNHAPCQRPACKTSCRGCSKCRKRAALRCARCRLISAPAKATLRRRSSSPGKPLTNLGKNRTGALGSPKRTRGLLQGQTLRGELLRAFPVLKG